MTTNTTDTAPIICHFLRQVDALVAERLFGWRWWLPKTCLTNHAPELRPAGYYSESQYIQCPSPIESPPPQRPFEHYTVDLDHIPHYTTWAMLGEVVAKVEAAGYWVSMEGACGLGMNPDEPDAALHPMGSTEESAYATGPTIPVALCLAVLAAFGCRVQLELGGES